MATYVVGDVQGCIEPLQRLCAHVGFDKSKDRLWLAGDLVNRGPESLAALRFVRELGDRAVMVLGNHDLHLMSRVANVARATKRDTLGPLLQAEDRFELCDWLAARPLVHQEDGFTMVHAGLHPAWDDARALELAHELEAMLRGRERLTVLRAIADMPAAERWSDELTGTVRTATLAAIFTRLRVLSPDGRMRLSFTGKPDRSPMGFVPWFTLPSPRQSTVVFGHWASLGLHVGERAVCLDTGCVWGQKLTALRLEDRQVFSVPAVVVRREPVGPR